MGACAFAGIVNSKYRREQKQEDQEEEREAKSSKNGWKKNRKFDKGESSLGKNYYKHCGTSGHLTIEVLSSISQAPTKSKEA